MRLKQRSTAFPRHQKNVMRNKQRSTAFLWHQKTVRWKTNNEAQPSWGTKRLWDEKQTTKHSIPEAPKDCGMRNKQRNTAYPRQQKTVEWGTNNETQPSRGTKIMWDEKQTTKRSLPEAPKDYGMRNKHWQIERHIWNNQEELSGIISRKTIGGASQFHRSSGKGYFIGSNNKNWWLY